MNTLMELLDPVEGRVLGALIEKEATTPEYYPLSLNALVTACNQKSNRYPVVEYDEGTVRDAIERLRAKRLAMVIIGSGRVTKYSQTISEKLNLGRRELAALCVLLLRGPQTLGEVKDRAERIFSFADLEEAERTLEKLAEAPSGALVVKLPRQPGQKEARYAHLLAGEPVIESTEEVMEVASAPGSRITQLESEIQELRIELADLKRRFEELEAQLR
ncbi:MAG: DUF480 domain-containing protein [Bryobacteraceae bacterium]